MFEGQPRMQRILRRGLLGMEYNYELDDTDEDNYDIDSWVHGYNHFRGYPRFADLSDDRELSGDHTRSSSSVYQSPLHYWTPTDFLRQSSIKVQAKESDTERRARLLQETKKSKEKAEKKRLKKQKQKERKKLEKLEKEKQQPVKMEEEKDGAQQSKAEDNQSANEKSNNNKNSSVKNLASAKDIESSESSEDESSNEDSDTKNDSGDSEELDMTSTFVRLAKLKLEQKPKPEKKEKKKVPVKEECKPVHEKSIDQDVEKKDSATLRCPTIEDNIKISTELASIGNKFAGSGDYNMAVKYFTDAIKYNPKEFKLFGNRSFCFEKMQEYGKALNDAELCLRLGPGWVKGLFRKGRALAGLKRYEEAAQAFREVLKLDGACAEAAQELMRVQITQLMEYGFTREQSSNALIIHGTVKKALEVLTKLNPRPGASQNPTYQPAQLVNVTGVSPVLSANSGTAPAPPRSRDVLLQNKLLGQSQPKAIPNQATMSSSHNNRTPMELFPIWVGNLVYPVTESTITNLFNKVGFVYSVKVLTIKRCAFVNFTKQEHCEEAIRRFHGFDLNGMKIAVRYPDRIPHGMGISKSALKADNLQDENMRQNDYADERNAVGGRRPLRPYKPVPDHNN
ncbi:hsp70-Hsp90 organizing protein 2-like isoform X2 [Anabas testudineus]|nr:hsp70-Hsp90 organizing protein 2-like isoform X2 [Anabas testudineus]XP_026208901.1 hsp70-Hsp90 organizing protein 2-like isoform X2 [Anabas testudineus]XP_026208903.1 hsp70-Hsp90 organizing protein 2-like isoform X2 [Anabas testudineus]